jgi:hypothetical protein
MTTINQIIKNLSDFADAHYQINNFGSGEVYDLATSGVTNYPLMYVDVNPANIVDDIQQTNIEIYLVDRLTKGFTNWAEVYSDMQRVALDVVAHFLSGAYFPNMRVQQNVNFDPVRYSFGDDEIAGWRFVLTFNQFFDQDRCSIPQLGFNYDTYTPPATASSGVVTITDSSTGAIITTVACGGTYAVLQFSGIDGGLANTIFTNSIVAS